MRVRGCDTRVDPVLLGRAQRECGGKLCARRNGLPTKTRVYTVVPGFGPSNNLGVYNNSVNAVERAFVERYFLCKHPDGFKPALRPRAGQFSTKWFESFRRDCLRHMPYLPVLTFDETLNLFPANKRKVYQAALNSYSTQGPVTVVDSRLKPFVKFEKQDVAQAPRIINPRSPRYNLEVARYLKHFEHHMFNAINAAYGAHTASTVIKGMDANASADCLREKWDRFADPIAIGLDASKFDMHVSPAALRYEHTYYNQYWQSKRLAELLEMQCHNAGRARCDDGYVDFKMKGTRSSGDMNTSLGNCILMCAMVYSHAKEVGVRVELANNGDDCVVFMERADEARYRELLVQWFDTKGFVMKVEPTAHEFEEIEFCQTHPVLVGGGWQMVRDPRACLRKDVMCLRTVQNERVFRKWIWAVGDGGCNANGGVPVLSAFYRRLRNHGVENDQFKDLVSPHRFASVSRRCTEVTPEARASFWVAFGLTPPEQEAIERLLMSRSIGDVDWNEIEREDLDIELPGTQLLSW